MNLGKADKCAINDILAVMCDKKMYVNEKKLYLTAIDLLYDLGYYDEGINNNEPSLYLRNR